MALEQDASSAQKISVLVVEKEATMLSTLHRLANCVKMGQQKKLFLPNDVSVSLAAVLPTTIFGQVLESCSQYF